MNKEGTFAFVRFKEYGGALKAIENTNGLSWLGKKLTVRMSRTRGVHNGPPSTLANDWLKRRVIKKWVPVLKKLEGEMPRDNMVEENKTGRSMGKEVTAVWAEGQKERLQRSLLGVCVKPIEFRKIMNFLLEEWDNPGDIEVRVVGPYRCLITFSNSEIRDKAIDNKLLLSVFDEAEFGAEVAGESERNERIATKPRRLKLEPMRTHHWSRAYASWPWAAHLFGRTYTYVYASRASMRTHRSLPASINRGAFQHFKGAHFHI
ncbi:hypothetical protein PIB30_030454 [Stylosanthes scabra]|uniref:RRM domain-containing protein n=1 Tax=Stylosanthes scabra TaxID=79078 RepID=A0ABU6TB91_9FABA|nr:hypothetical protein [Stylosanthes scabra]